jgi:hypothetical protein
MIYFFFELAWILGGKFVHFACMFVVGHRNGKPKLKTNNGFFLLFKNGNTNKDE